MPESNTTTVSGGIGFTGLLAVLFIGLKLTGYINWSWFWVLAPLWIPFALVSAIVLTIIVVALTLNLFDKISKKR